MTLPDTCSQCGQHYQTCRKCQEKIIFVPTAGFGNAGKWKHLEPFSSNRGVPHQPHPTLVIT